MERLEPANGVAGARPLRRARSGERVVYADLSQAQKGVSDQWVRNQRSTNLRVALVVGHRGVARMSPPSLIRVTCR
jgi:hypothetical protein